MIRIPDMSMIREMPENQQVILEHFADEMEVMDPFEFPEVHELAAVTGIDDADVETALSSLVARQILHVRFNPALWRLEGQWFRSFT